MYSTRRLHKNLVDGAAYITIGDPFKDDKAPAPDRWKGKRLSCPAHPPPYFTPFSYTSEPYVGETDMYVKSQPLDQRKAGFGSRDASKRDEFALTLRMEAHRETLRKEMKLSSKRNGDPPQANTTPASALASTSEPRSFLYDIGRGRTTAFNPKLRRDTFYPPHATGSTSGGGGEQGRGQSRRLRPYRLASQDVGQGIWAMEHAPPEHGQLSCTKAFYDASHLHVASPY